jgi:hypothetical protein
MKKCALSFLLATSVLSMAQMSLTSRAAPHQQQPSEQRRGGGQAFRSVGGAIQSVNGDIITLTTRDGGTATVKVSSDTRFMREGQPAKLSDFKAGDRVMVRGESTGENTWKAEMVGTPRMMIGGGGAGQGMQGATGGPNMERFREGLGKEFIAGEIKSIDGTKLTVHGPDGKDYVAEVDENTSFRKSRESITFPDIKVGDHVMGRGKVNGEGVFVPEVLNVGGMFVRQGAPPQQQPPASPKN